jgi:putative ABC transport system ATP-binding protein
MPAVFELAGVARAYDSGGYRVTALAAVDLAVGRGEHVALMGPSGSGKSTLLSLLGLLLRPTAGRVLVDGVDTTRLDDAAVSAIRAESLGFVFQSFHLLPRMTVLENVELPLVYGRVETAERRAAAMDALARVGLQARAYSMPGELSGGQCQRVAIARAVARKPVAILCDEPTGNLDSTAASRVRAMMRELNGDGMTIVVATHDPVVAGDAHRLVRIRDGRAIEGRAARVPDA